MSFVYELIPADRLDEVQKVNERLGQKRKSTDWMVDKDRDAFLLCHRRGRYGADASWLGEYVFSCKGLAFCFKVLLEKKPSLNGAQNRLTYHVRGIDQQLMDSSKWSELASLIAEALDELQQSVSGQCEACVSFADKDVHQQLLGNSSAFATKESFSEAPGRRMRC